MTALVLVRSNTIHSRLVGLTGAAGVGKTAVAAELAKHGYAHMSFGAPVVAIAAEQLGRAPDDVRDRDLLCAIRAHVREHSPGALIEQARRTLMLMQGRFVVFDDVTTDDEADFVRNAGGIVVELKLPEALRRQRLWTSGLSLTSEPTKASRSDATVAVRATHFPSDIASAIASVTARVAA